MFISQADLYSSKDEDSIKSNFSKTEQENIKRNCKQEFLV